MTDKLKPCPFCGAAPQMATEDMEDVPNKDDYMVSLIVCAGCNVDMTHRAKTTKVSRAEAIAMWNRRTA